MMWYLAAFWIGGFIGFSAALLIVAAGAADREDENKKLRAELRTAKRALQRRSRSRQVS